MDNQRQEHENETHGTWGFFAGLLLGSLAGVGTILLLAPQSGKKTRAQIQQKSIELRDQTTEVVADAVAKAGVKAREITTNVHEQAEALQERGQAILDEQKERFSTVVEAGKKAVQGSQG